MQPEESQAAEGFANQQVMMTESKSSLPVVVGILYAIYQILPILGIDLAAAGEGLPVVPCAETVRADRLRVVAEQPAVRAALHGQLAAPHRVPETLAEFRHRGRGPRGRRIGCLVRLFAAHGVLPRTRAAPS